MNDENLISSLDRRVSGHDKDMADIKRDFTEVSHEIKEILNRVNNGLSPSVGEVRKENSEIRLSIQALSHKIELDMIEMKGMVRETTEHTRHMVDNFDKHKVTPVANEMNFIKKTFVYGLVGALIVFLGQLTMKNLWDKIFKPETPIVRGDDSGSWKK